MLAKQSPKKKKNKKDEAHKEKIAARKEAAIITAYSAEANASFQIKPIRRHWTELRAYVKMPALVNLGVPCGGEGTLMVAIDKVIELLIDEREAMIDLEDANKNTGTKQLKEALEAARDAATTGIARHFRKASVFVHPDKHGDLYMREFERLKSAYDILRDTAIREDYLNHMLDQYLLWQTASGVRFIANFFQNTHQTWIDKHELRKEHDTAHFKYERQATEARNERAKEVLFVEAAVYGRPPGYSYIKSRDPASRKLVLCLAFSEIEEFSKVAEVIVVQAYPMGDEDHICEMARLERPQLEVQLAQAMQEGRSAVEVPLTFEEHCEWNIQWHAILHVPDLDKPEVATASTRKMFVDLTHPALNSCVKEYPVLLSLSTQRAAELRVVCRQLKAKETNNPQVLQGESWRLHRLISKGRSVARRLHTCLAVLGQSANNCKSLTDLTAACDQAIHAKSNLDQLVSQGQRKNALKSLKQSVATMIESGELSDWIENVNKSELANHGGETNRLYQILIEGKKANSLLVDSSALIKAAERSDMFSEKQCRALKDRATEVDSLMAAEAKRLVMEEKRQRDEAAMRARLEVQAKGMPLRGSLVKIFGLQKRYDLNGSLGYYMGVNPAADGRFIVKLLNETEVSLKKDNFHLYNKFEDVRRDTPVQEAVPPSRNPGIPDGAASRNHREEDQQQKTTRVSTLSAANPPPKNEATIFSKKTTAALSAVSTKSRCLKPPARYEATWIFESQVDEFIGRKGANVKNIASETKTLISVFKHERYVTADGREWVMVKVDTMAGSTNNARKALKVIDAWVVEHDPGRKQNKSAPPDTALSVPSYSCPVVDKSGTSSGSGDVARNRATTRPSSYLEMVRKPASLSPMNQAHRQNNHTEVNTSSADGVFWKNTPTKHPTAQNHPQAQEQSVLSSQPEDHANHSDQHTEVTTTTVSPLSLPSTAEQSPSPTQKHQSSENQDPLATHPTTLFSSLENEIGHDSSSARTLDPHPASVFSSLETQFTHQGHPPEPMNPLSSGFFRLLDNNVGHQNHIPEMTNSLSTSLFSTFGLPDIAHSHDISSNHETAFHNPHPAPQTTAVASGLDLMGFLRSQAGCNLTC